MRELPRLTRSLRAFTDLGQRRQPENEKNNLIAKRLERAAKSKKCPTWSEICKSVHQNVVPYLNQIHNEAFSFCEGQASELIDEAAIFILKLLINETNVSQKNFKILRQTFGPITLEMANKIMQIMKSIREQISEESLNHILDSEEKENRSHDFPPNMFGIDIPFNPAKVSWPETKQLQDMSAKNPIKITSKFTMAYNVDTVLSNKTEFEKSRFTKGLKKCYEKYSAEMQYEDFGHMIVDKLKCGGDNLQTELFDLLGYENIEFIEYVLEHQKSIIALFSIQKIPKNNLPLERPQVGCQVIVRSEKEKQLMKQYRKEEKKLSKISNKFDSGEDDDDENFNPIELRLKRQEALMRQAMQAPILNTTKKSMFPSASQSERYPFVFDSKITAKAAAGFVSGQKVMLPENVERKDSQLCEEVHIPVPPAAVLDVGNNPVMISTLDEVGQMAFQGIKSLNRIQSIVFNAAYQTNENLLICAPTGAGKTNVAMLTVVHQIKLHIAEGVLKRDQFKIVYIAPMKALAAEMTASFNKRLGCLGVSVRELTGDMQLTKVEIQQTQMIVTTPEKWDVVTRKGTGDIALTSIVKLLIIDEVHLLHGDRGPVVEALVARTLRQVESSQSMIRIVGLSATLPNYTDVAKFLRVNLHKGLFYFDHRFRPVPLGQTFIGVKAIKPMQQMADMDLVCYNHVVDMVRKGHQVMVFVHARNATVRTATVLKEMALQNGTHKQFMSEGNTGLAQKALAKSRNKHLGELFSYGFSVHHAGMLRTDRNLVEKYFSEGLIKVLVCTSTLAWGVNLPAHAVVIRGTEIYDSKHGSFIDLGILDVLQIFGRAGRPQFDTSGHGTIITSHNKLSHYLSLLTNQFPIESNFIAHLADNLNAEITLGTISNVEEAVEWLSYTYLFVRMRLNPQVYGINYQDVIEDSNLERKRKELIDTAAKALDKARMIRYIPRTGDLSVTDLGRTASHFYIKYDTVEIFNEHMKPIMTEADILGMISSSQEFEQLKVRDDEMDELDNLTRDYCEVLVQGGAENIHGKVNILLQTYLSRGRVNSFSLLSDQSYITQNAVRICRALFEIVLRKNNAIMAGRLLGMAKMLERQQWDHMSPMRQFCYLPQDIITKIEERHLTMEKLKEMDIREIGNILRNQKMATSVKKCCSEFPALELEATLQPITRTVLRIRLKICPDFRWNDRVHGKSSEAFWIWIEDPDSNFIYHHEYFMVSRKMVYEKADQDLVMTIPLSEPLPAQYFVKAVSDRWLGCEMVLALSFQGLILPETHPPHTDLLELQPLPVTALKDAKFEKLYKFSHFNPIQTQIFHCLYHTDNNVLLGAPTGSGKTIAAEIAMFRVFREYPDQKVVYIAPLKALVRERITDWKVRIEEKLGRSVVELTGDVSPDIRAIAGASVIVTTPEKWDGISRSWQTRNYVQKVALIIIDEIHLLGEDRGPVLEVIVSRTNFIASHTSKSLRIVGLSTALANAVDLASWLGIERMGLYNFRPSVRPVPLEVHISGFPGKHYCPRMATMNRPTFQAIRQHAPCSPSLVFVSSRRQTRLTALDLIAYLAAEDDPKQWLHMLEDEMDNILVNIKDSNLKLTLAFGIGLHHAGLQDRDRRTVEELFVNNKIQVLITTATLAWGVNFPAHLVVIKGTEYYDGKLKRYVDMPITDVLQMMGRAGRPQFDDSGVAVVLVHDIKKNFYKKFLYEPFPVESSLLEVLPDHINAEIVAGTIKNKQEFLDYLTWTYFFRRLMKNPRYYELEVLEPEEVNRYLSGLVEKTLNVLIDSYCVDYDEDQQYLSPLPMGRIASFYYLAHQTMLLFNGKLQASLPLDQLLRVLCDAYEYNQLPVRHNEDLLNEELARICRFEVDSSTLDSPNTKTFLLLQAHFSRLPLPCADYLTDLKSVLDQAIRILQAIIDIVSDRGWLVVALRLMQLLQMIIQSRWIDESALLTLPYLEKEHLRLFSSLPKSLPMLCEITHGNYKRLANALREELTDGEIQQIHQVIKDMPVICVELTLQGWWANGTTEKKIPQPPGPDCWIDVHENNEYTLIVSTRRKNHSQSLKAHCPKFPRGKDEGWFLVLGNESEGELLALKRATGIRGQRRSNQLYFATPPCLGKLIIDYIICCYDKTMNRIITNSGRQKLTFYLMSDCYLGLDQQYDLHLNVISSPHTDESLDM